MSTKTAVLAALVVGGAVSGLWAGVPVAANGQAKAVIVSNGNKESAEALKKYLDKITGAALGIVERAADAKAGSVIELKVASVEGLSNDDRGKQGYRLKTTGSALTLTSPTADGLSNAVYGYPQRPSEGPLLQSEGRGRPREPQSDGAGDR